MLQGKWDLIWKECEIQFHMIIEELWSEPCVTLMLWTRLPENQINGVRSLFGLCLPTEWLFTISNQITAMNLWGTKNDWAMRHLPVLEWLCCWVIRNLAWSMLWRIGSYSWNDRLHAFSMQSHLFPMIDILCYHQDVMVASKAQTRCIACFHLAMYGQTNIHASCFA